MIPMHMACQEIQWNGGLTLFMLLHEHEDVLRQRLLNPAHAVLLREEGDVEERIEPRHVWKACARIQEIEKGG